MQEMSLDYHFTVEQEVGSSTYAFFGFNGKLESWVPLLSLPMFFFVGGVSSVFPFPLT
jgi:hypothetical protein